MQGAQRERLIRTMAGEPAFRLGVALKCGAAIAVLILLAAIASDDGDVTQVPAAGIALQRPGGMARMYGAEAHRKEVFDVRRAASRRYPTDRDIAGYSPTDTGTVPAP